MNKVAIYCRVSTNEQTNVNQELRLIEYCKQRNLVYDLFTEVESSRKTRPVKQEMLSLLRNHEYDALIVYKLDRFARSTIELLLDVKELLDKGISFISLSDNLDFTTAAGKLQFQILSAFSEFERSLIRERTLEGLRRSKLQGRVLGRPKGSKDKRKRSNSGYVLREAIKRKSADGDKGIHKDIKTYIK